MAIGFDLITNQDLPCSRCFSGDSVRADFATRGQSALTPGQSAVIVHVASRRSFFLSCFAALNAGQSGPTPQTVRESIADSPPFFFLPRSELFLIVQFLGVERRTVRPSTPDSPRPDPWTVRAPYGRQSGPMQLVLFSLILSSTFFIYSRLIHCTSWSRQRYPATRWLVIILFSSAFALGS